jgi:hypothetical protein
VVIGLLLGTFVKVGREDVNGGPIKFGVLTGD